MIDFHVHQPSGGGSISLYGNDPYDADAWISAMDHFGIERSVVFTLDGLWDPGRASNDALRQWIGGHDDRLVGFGTVDPQRADAAEETERCLSALGFRGMKFHPWAQGVSPQQPSMDPIAEVAAAHRAPMLFHDGTPPYCTPLQIAALARRHPATPIVLGHGGLQDLFREAAAAVCSAENVYVCLCCTPDVGMRYVAAHVPAERLLWGSDAGIAPDPRSAFVAERVEQARLVAIPEAVRQLMLVDNPARLLAAAT